MRNPYFVLGVQREAGKDDIKGAYRRLAMAFHPDQNPGDFGAQERFAEINAAYQILGSPERLREFDEGLIDAQGRRRPAGGMGRRKADPFAAADMNRRPAEPEKSADDIAERIFGDAFQQSRSKAGAGDAAARATIKDAPGIDDVPLDGRPARPEDRAPAAKKPRSWSFVDAALKPLFGLMGGRDGTAAPGETHVTFEIPLEDVLKGAEHTITRADGAAVSFRVAPGAAEGETIRLAGEGESGEDGQRGDLCVTLAYLPHERLRAVRRDLVLAVPVTLDQAVFGASLAVESLDGRIEIAVPEWSDSGVSIRVPARGLPDRDGLRGDLVCELRLMLPAERDDKLVDLLRMQRGAWYV